MAKEFFKKYFAVDIWVKVNRDIETYIENQCFSMQAFLQVWGSNTCNHGDLILVFISFKEYKSRLIIFSFIIKIYSYLLILMSAGNCLFWAYILFILLLIKNISLSLIWTRFLRIFYETPSTIFEFVLIMLINLCI